MRTTKLLPAKDLAEAKRVRQWLTAQGYTRFNHKSLFEPDVLDMLQQRATVLDGNLKGDPKPGKLCWPKQAPSNLPIRQPNLPPPSSPATPVATSGASTVVPNPFIRRGRLPVAPDFLDGPTYEPNAKPACYSKGHRPVDTGSRKGWCAVCDVDLELDPSTLQWRQA